MTRNAAERKDIRKQEKAEAARIAKNKEFVQAAMNTVQGRAWFRSLLESCHIFSDPYTGRALDEAFLKGERNLGLRIYNDVIRWCPDQFVQMMRESTEEEGYDSGNAPGQSGGTYDTEYDFDDDNGSPNSE